MIKGIDFDTARALINRDSPITEKSTIPVRIPKDTWRLLRKIKKANGLKSYRAVIELLIATVALEGFASER